MSRRETQERLSRWQALQYSKMIELIGTYPPAWLVWVAAIHAILVMGLLAVRLWVGGVLRTISAATALTERENNRGRR